MRNASSDGVDLEGLVKRTLEGDADEGPRCGDACREDCTRMEFGSRFGVEEAWKNLSVEVSFLLNVAGSVIFVVHMGVNFLDMDIAK